jgi:hypothetical protein
MPKPENRAESKAQPDLYSFAKSQQPIANRQQSKTSQPLNF